MPEPKRTPKPPRIKAGARRRKADRPPVIDSMPFFQEAYYSGLGLIDLASEQIAKMPAELRRLEKVLVARGLKRNAVLTEQFDAARADLNRRGRELQARAQRTLSEIRAALRRSNAGATAGGQTTPAAE